MTRVSGATSRDPDFWVFSGNNIVARAESPPAASETITQSFTAGDYVIDAYDFFNVDSDSNNNSDSCYNFSITG